jgi:hypothetical protein
VTRWSHLHTAAVSALAGAWFTHGWWAVAALAAALLVGILIGRFWASLRGARKRLQAEIQHRIELQRLDRLRKLAGLRTDRARARLAEAKARDAKSIAAGERRRAARARGVTASEVAELQAGSLVRGRL